MDSDNLIAVRINLVISIGWKARCAEYFPYSTYFGGIMSAITTNSVNHSSDIAPENGLLGQQVKTKGEEVLSLNGSVHVVDGMNSLSIR